MFFVLCLLGALASLGLWALSRRSDSPAAARLGASGAIVLSFAAVSQAITMVPAGHVGVVDLFGSVSAQERKPGLNLVNPLARVVKLSVQTQEIKEQMEVPSQEGLNVQLEASILFHLDPERADEIYKTVGPEYVAVILEPQFRSVARGVTAQFEARALYTSEREKLSDSIAVEVRKRVEPRGIAVESTPLRKITLPSRLAAAIEEKLGSEQESQRMQFVLAKERQEAERRRIEAQGIADFQRIVSQGINEQLLKWKGIEATAKLAESQNTKVVVIGSGKEGLPLILGGQ
jgi:regulator of protease activity HflC (stomatin/prohibitin superfamily)